MGNGASKKYEEPPPNLPQSYRIFPEDESEDETRKMGSRKAPDGSLSLEWVFGYNGHTARNNVKVTPEGHLVYYVAGVGVIYDVVSGKQSFFDGHSDDITSIGMDVAGETVATGQVGKDAYIAVWDTNTTSPLSVIHDAHTHKVSSVAFSRDKTLLASVGGPEHKQELVVWDWMKARRVARAVAYSGKVEEVEWDPKSNMRLVTCGQKHVKFWKLRGNVLQASLGILGQNRHEDQVTVSHLKDGTVVTGSKSGDLLVWQSNRVKNLIEDVHEGGVLATEPYRHGLLTGGRDGNIQIFDHELKKIATIPGVPSMVYDKPGPVQSISIYNDMVIIGTQLNEIVLMRINTKHLQAGDDSGHHSDDDNPFNHEDEDEESEMINASRNVIKESDRKEIIRQFKKKRKGSTTKEGSDNEDGDDGIVLSAAFVVQGHGMGEVWGLATHPSRNIACTASDDGTIRLWDLESRRPTNSVFLEEDEARAVAYSPDGSHIAVGLKEGTFIVVDSESLEELVRIKDREEVRHDLKYSPSGKLLAVASNDNFVDIYHVKNFYKHIRTLSGCSSFITHLDWTSNSRFIQVNSGAGERLIFQVEEGERVDETSLPRDTEWSSWTCVLGTNVAGLWHKYSDLSEINAVDANFYYGVAVTGDDFGLVKLFRFPCPKKGSKSRSGVGHSEHVTNVRWTSDSGHVVSVGGADHAVFMWRFKPSRSMGDEPYDTVTLRRPDDDDDDDPLDTEDEYEGIPEITQDVEEDILKERARLRELRKIRKDEVLAGVQLATDSTFTKRCEAEQDTDSDNSPPDYSLKMMHVFGYRTHGCRNNLKWLKSGEVVYHVAGTAVISDPESRKQKHYLHHTDDILCLTIHPDRETVASGQIGKEACVHVWSSANQKILSYLGGGHQRGVSAVTFSSDGTRLGSLGMDDFHTVVIWNWIKGYKVATSRGSSNNVYGLRFSSHSNRKLVSYGERHIRVWNQVGGGLSWRQAKLTNKFKGDTILCSAVSGDTDSGERWIFGCVSGQVLLMEDSSIQRSAKAHKGHVYSIVIAEDAVWTAGQDGYICQWDFDVKKCLKVLPVTDHFVSRDVPVGLTISQPGIKALDKIPDRPLLVGTSNAEIITMNSEGKITIVVQGHGKGELWGLDTHPTLQEAVTVSEDRTLKRWGLEERRVIGSLNIRKPARSVGYHPSGTMIAIGFMDGSVSLLDYPQLDQRGGANHRKEMISEVKFSPDGRLLAVGSHDSFVDLYVIDSDNDTVSKESTGMRRVGVCKAASSFITHVTWGVDSRLLQVNTGAGEQLFYEAPHAVRQLIPESTQGNLAWTSPLTCVLDDTVSGVWERGMDLTDINALATAHELPLLATASDGFGLVNLFRYPSRGKLKRHREYLGHSSHVTNVRWSFDDSLLLTTGGADTAVVVWSIRDSEETSPLPHQDVPDQDLSVEDLEVADMFNSNVPKIKEKKSSPRSKARRRRAPSVLKVQSLAKEMPEIALNEILKRVRPIPTLLRDDVLFYCAGNIVGRINTDSDEDEPMPGYQEHNNVVTAITISTVEPIMVATAEISSQLVEKTPKEEELWPWEEQGALIHVWRPSDGSMITALTGSKNDAVITSLSFSQSGRFLASLVDASAVHVFNWIKGVHVASAPLKSDSVITIAHVAETTIAALTPRALLLCDLVGNALLPTHTHVKPGLMDNSTASYTTLSVNHQGRVFVGCSDGTVIEWSGRVAIRKALPPDFTLKYPLPQRIAMVAGRGVVFAASRPDKYVLVHSYNTSRNELYLYSTTKTPSPTPDWVPCTIRLGKSTLIIGSRKGEPFVLLDLVKGKFSVIEPDYELKKIRNEIEITDPPMM